MYVSIYIYIYIYIYAYCLKSVCMLCSFRLYEGVPLMVSQSSTQVIIYIINFFKYYFNSFLFALLNEWIIDACVSYEVSEVRSEWVMKWVSYRVILLITTNNNYKSYIAPISSKRMEFSSAPSTGGWLIDWLIFFRFVIYDLGKAHSPR